MLVSALTGYRRELGRQQKRITLLLFPAVSVPARVPAKTMMELWHLAIRKIGTAMNRIVSLPTSTATRAPETILIPFTIIAILV